MGTNTDKGFRHGEVKDRYQIFNNKTGLYVKYDAITHKKMDSSKVKFKGVRLVNKH